MSQDGFYWACACVPSGRITSEDYLTFADIADKYDSRPQDSESTRVPGICKMTAGSFEQSYPFDVLFKAYSLMDMA